ncbi:MAG: hypothetical protein AAF357_01435 [Verrucomicrobiota bacterium]
MKRTIIIFGVVGIVVGILILGFMTASMPGIPRGKQRTERGEIYYFKDGIVAIDMTVDPHEFHIFANHPESRSIKKAEIIEGGVRITGPRFTDDARADLEGRDLSLGFTAPKLPGKVRVTMNQGNWTDLQQLAIEPVVILEFLKKKDWDASVREIWEESP